MQFFRVFLHPLFFFAPLLFSFFGKLASRLGKIITICCEQTHEIPVIVLYPALLSAFPYLSSTSMVRETEPNSSYSPQLLQDRKLSASISHVSICSSMDLLALVLDKTSVAIFRTSWQRLTTIPVCTNDNQSVTALAWSPDGASIAVATSAADLAIYSVDRSSFASTGKTKRAARDAAGPVASVSLKAKAECIEWAGISAADGTVFREGGYEDRAALLEREGNDDYARSGAGLLFVGDCEGTLLVMMHHLLFTVVRKQVMLSGCALQGLRVSSDLRHCLVIGQCLDGCNGDEPMSAEEVWVLRCVDLQHMVEFLPEIERVGLEVVALHSFGKELAKVSEVIEKEWVMGAAHILRTNVLQPLEKALGDFAEQGSKSPWEALHDVFCGARVRGAMLQFLAAELGENGAKEALRAFRNHVSLLLGSLHSFLPLLERAIFRLSEFRALSRLTARFKPTGVLFDLADDLFQLAENLFLIFGELSWETEKLTNETEAFLAWLVLAAARASEDSLQGRGSSSGNVGGEDARLVSQFFQTALSIEAKVARNDLTEMNSVNQMYRSRVKEAITKFEAHSGLVVAKPSLFVSAALDVDEGLYVRVPASGKDTRTRFSLSRFQSGDKYKRQAFVSLVTAEGHLVSIQRNFGQADWSIAHLRLLQHNLFIHEAAMQGKNKLVLLASEQQAEDVRPLIKSRNAYHLFLHDFDSGCHVYDIVRKDETVTNTVGLPQVRGITGEVSKFVNLDKLGSNTNVLLSVDSERHTAM